MTVFSLPRSATPSATPALQSGIQRSTLGGMIASIVLLVIMIAWAQWTLIGGAVIASGQVVVRGKPKMVQSLDGGVVEEIRVRSGDVVKAHDLLLRLDPTLLQVNLDISRSRLAEALARRSRLEAEQFSLAEPDFTYAPLPFATPDTGRAEVGERQIFTARRDLIASRRAQLDERILQFANQTTGIDGIIASKQEQIALVDQELANVRKLYEQGLIQESQMLALQRGRAELLGQLAEQRSELARVINASRDAELELELAERQFHEEVVTDLRTTMTETEELQLEIVTLSRQLDRVDIRAPSDGIVHELQVTTIGGVVAPGEVILQVVPLSEGVEFEMRLDPREIDRVHVGQKAQVAFTAFDQRATPRLDGSVTSISPDAIVDQATGDSFFRLGLAIDPAEIERLGNVDLMPGMPVEGFLETSDRSVMSYLLQPLTSQISRAFRED